MAESQRMFLKMCSSSYMFHNSYMLQHSTLLWCETVYIHANYHLSTCVSGWLNENQWGPKH